MLAEFLIFEEPVGIFLDKKHGGNVDDGNINIIVVN